jgi:hypothetical protein
MQNVVMVNGVYAECHYADCRYAECRGVYWTVIWQVIHRNAQDGICPVSQCRYN